MTLARLVENILYLLSPKLLIRVMQNALELRWRRTGKAPRDCAPRADAQVLSNHSARAGQGRFLENLAVMAAGLAILLRSPGRSLPAPGAGGTRLRGRAGCRR